MKCIEKIRNKCFNAYSERQFTIAFLGDSVTQGCFENYPAGNGFGNIFDNEAVYHNALRKILNLLYPQLPVNIINAGIGGDTAPKGLKRLERDVLSYHPDLTVVCYGLNDFMGGMDAIGKYKDALKGIIAGVRGSGSDMIFMTPNITAIKVSDRLPSETLRKIAVKVSDEFNFGTMDAYIGAAVSLCTEEGIAVCDCYSNWKLMEKAGVDITSLLSNGINHPAREMHFMFAYELVKTMLADCQ